MPKAPKGEKWAGAVPERHRNGQMAALIQLLGQFCEEIQGRSRM